MSNYSKNDPESIQKMFGTIAKKYDRTNAILSFQLHKRWNRTLVKQVLDQEGKNKLLDLCCGTGEIAFTHLNKVAGRSEVYLLDFCEGMLTCAKEKALQAGYHQKHILNFIQADALDIPLSDSSVDCVTMAYGIRNVKDPEKCIKEVYRVLRPGGKFGILELTQPNSKILKFGHHIYLRSVLPLLGWCLTSNQDAYEYLCKSIHTFIKPKELEQVFKKAGFQGTLIKPLSFGIATVITGKKTGP